jgi:hypothetical protein
MIVPDFQPVAYSNFVSSGACAFSAQRHLRAPLENRPLEKFATMKPANAHYARNRRFHCTVLYSF